MRNGVQHGGIAGGGGHFARFHRRGRHQFRLGRMPRMAKIQRRSSSVQIQRFGVGAMRGHRSGLAAFIGSIGAQQGRFESGVNQHSGKTNIKSGIIAQPGLKNALNTQHGTSLNLPYFQQISAPHAIFTLAIAAK